MGKPVIRYVCRAVPGLGWRIWDRKMNKWWGNPFSYFPQLVIDELNGEKRPDALVSLTRPKNTKKAKTKRDRS